MSETAAQTSCPTWSREDPDQQELTAILDSFKTDNEGVISLGKDGILRSLTAERDVIGAAPLRPSLIAALHARLPKDYIDQYITPEWDGLDGLKTPESAWYNPDKGILPEPLSELRRRKAAMQNSEASKTQEPQTSVKQGQEHEQGA